MPREERKMSSLLSADFLMGWEEAKPNRKRKA